MRDKTADALYKLYTPQKHHPKAKIFNKEYIKPGDLLIRFNKRKKPKKTLTVEEIMEKEEAKKKSKKRRRRYRKKTVRGLAKTLKKKKKKKQKGGRRTRKKRGGEPNSLCNCEVGDFFTLKEEGHGHYDDQGIYEITKIQGNYIYFNQGEEDFDDEKNVIITQLRDYFEPYNQRASTPGGRKKKRRRTKKKRRRRR